jgi:hypothetical protein
MPFSNTDIYTSSGSVMLQNSWTPYVSKYDTSSFYNWEQDNLPLYDLEERTYENWEQAGYPTSAVTGFALTVSADATAAVLAANNNVFTTLSSCIAAIPKVVRFPVLVEVGSFGDIGSLELHNFRIEEGGSIEIINRNFGRVLNSSGDCHIAAIPGYNKSHTMMTTVSSLDLSTTLTDTQCVHLGSNVFQNAADGVVDTRTANTGNAVFYPKHSLRKAPLTVSLQSTPPTAIANEFLFSPYESIDHTATDNTLYGIDVSATNQATDLAMYRAQLASDEELCVGGNTYFNRCFKISVKNCDGPIYIRNFFVDGQSTATGGRDTGIEVMNSDVLLENCAAIRCREAGFKFNNSNVTLSRSAASYRNYKLTSTTTREAETGYGFHAINSDVFVSSLPVTLNTTGPGDVGASGVDCVVMASRNYAGWVLDNSQLRGGIQRRLASNPVTASIIGSELNTGYGFLLNNSKINVKGLLDIYGDDKGLQADGSHIVFQNLCIDAHSGEAIRSRNSSFLFDSPATPLNAGQAVRKQLDMSGNSQHIDLMKNSSFGFRRKNNIPTMYGNTSFEVAHGVIKYNGGNKSTLPALSVNDGSELDLIHAAIKVNNTSENIANVPSYGRAIKATQNSKVSCFGTGSGCTFAFGPAGITYQSKMAGMYASDSSEINIHGPAALGQFGVDILVEDNSTLNIEPARTRDAFGLEVSAFDLSSQANHTSVELHATRACLVANKNSVINMADLGSYTANWGRTGTGSLFLNQGADYPTNTFDTSAFTSSGSLQFYPNPQDPTTIGDFDLDDLNAGYSFAVPDLPVFTAKTGINRFFLTDNIINAESYTNLDHLTQGGVCLRATQDSVVNVKNVHFPLGANSSPLDGHYYTTSGTDCDKLMIWNIADTSRLNASYLSVSGMWPGSAQYHGPSSLWVSSSNGTDWGQANNAPAYGAPSHTPDTGSLSVYDAFGAGSSVWVVPSGVTVNNPFDAFYPVSALANDGGLNDETVSALYGAGVNVSGMTTYKWGAGPYSAANQGVFRIYWSPKTSARALQSDLSGYFKGMHPHGGVFSGCLGPPTQIFAQGYNCSAPLSAIWIDDGDGNNIVSGSYPDLLKLSYDSDGDLIADKLYTSGFYYCNEFVEDNPTQCMVDESAAVTFANAKNASVGMAGRPRKVTVYSSAANSADNRTSEAYIGDTSGSQGFKSASIFDLSRDN